ncbi:thiolase family protein [Streptomyces sp. V3I7]|uniref:thiolase family protein n=1 Tax=Streptomyces sp. V3I7 TaxID=3042278 RepID=UPI00278B7BCE|nr:thiolase family protein [Streptomyces sp. V3I7]MDQ0989339.1 acetyl-CoA acetyltransferase [Streptomyces sp. V3I7]
MAGPLTARPARRPAIAGLGITEMGRVYGRSAEDFAAEAVRLAVADAGLSLADVDGMLTNTGLTGGMGLGLQRRLQLRDLRLSSEIQAYGASAGAMVSYASMAVQAGMAETVVCVFADAPLTEGRRSSAAYAGRRAPVGFDALLPAAGLTSVNALYALAARRHMETYGTTSEQLGAIAVAQRQWAAKNPRAQLRDPITLDDHQNSRWIAEPLRLLDCCLVSNGGVAVVVTTAERAAHLPKPPVHVRGWAQSHPGYPEHRDSELGLRSGAAQSGPAALKMAGLSIADVTVAELYDCYTFTALLSLEDYGFCEKGEGGPFAASGALAPGGGRLAVNTGGGQLSSYYMWGMTPLSEAVIQARGKGGERQAPANDVVLVSGNGGILDHHSTLVLSPHADND